MFVFAGACVSVRACVCVCVCVCVYARARVHTQNSLYGRDFALYKYFNSIILLLFV